MLGRCGTCNADMTITLKYKLRRKTKRPQKYCNMKCYLNRNNQKSEINHNNNFHGNLKEILSTRPIFCCHCGTKFIRQRRDQICCTAKCSTARNKQQQNIILIAKRNHKLHRAIKCEQCNSKFKPNKTFQKFCSEQCCRRYNRLNQKARKLQARPKQCHQTDI